MTVQTEKRAPTEGLSKRAVVIGLVLVIVNAYWVGIASELWYSVFNLVNPFSNAIFTLVLLIIISAIVGRISRKWALSPAELMVIYVMVTMVTTISGHTMMAILLGTIAHPFWFASPENEWQTLFLQYIPTWFTVSDLDVLKGYFNGETTFHTWEHIRPWLVPIATWSALIFFLYFSLLCIVGIVRKQWIENEKLSYPIVQLPLAMATDRRKFFSSRIMWIGFGVAASVRVLNGLHDLFPVLPQIPYGYRLDRFFTDKPWNAIGYTNMSFNMAIIGLTYFMPLDLAFSCWFFFWLTRAERVVASMVGWRSLYLNERASGAWLGIGLLALWASRRHLIAFAKQVLGIEKMDESREPASYRSLTFLFWSSFAFLMLFCYFAGMSLWAAVAFFIIFYLMAIALARVRAELGPPYHEVIGINPRGMMVWIFGSRRLRAENLTPMTFLYAFNRCNRSHPMPCQIEAMKISERVGLPSRKMFGAITLAVAVGAVATFWSYMQITYKYGTLAKCRGWIGHFGWESFNSLQNWLQYPTTTSGRSVGFMGGGFLFVMFLAAMRTRFLWWKLHPSGYVLSGASWD